MDFMIRVRAFFGIIPKNGKYNNKYGTSYSKNGKCHRDGDLPAIEYKSGTKWWYQYGKIHRDGDLPAVVYAGGAELWYKDGKHHRDGDKPAQIDCAGKGWYKDGKRHRDGDLPAYISKSGDKEWWKNGLRHRDGDLPAILHPYFAMEWWKNGVQYTPDECALESLFSSDLYKSLEKARGEVKSAKDHVLEVESQILAYINR